MEHEKILMGTLPNKWGNEITKTVTLSVTENCNLSCKYCYMTGKNNKRRMSFDTAKRIIDYILLNKQKFNEDSVIWEFIGGEPFLEIDLIDKISDYIKERMFSLNHPWFNSYRFSISTNGILYDNPKVQEYIKKNHSHLSIGISIDGNKIKHDLQRVYPSGKGSYDDVVKNVPLWLEQFPNAATKATFAREDLQYLKESIISLWQLGIKIIPANLVYENIWKDGDDLLFESQLKSLADYIIEKELWGDYSVRFFDPNLGLPLSKEEINSNFCGAGKMIAADVDGNFYPCIRFLDFCLNNKKGLCIGDADNGISDDKLRPFYALTCKGISSKECLECNVASGCSWCTGFNYDNSDLDTIYERATYLCMMHKANVRANEYFWSRLRDILQYKTPKDEVREIREKAEHEKYLYFITSDHIKPHCNYKNWNNGIDIMDEKIFKSGVHFCEENYFTPIFLGRIEGLTDSYEGDCLFISENINKCHNANIIKIYNNTCMDNIDTGEVCILLLTRNDIYLVSENVKKLLFYYERVNIIIQDLDEWTNFDIKLYKRELENLKDYIIANYKFKKVKEINVLTDRLYLSTMCNCTAGSESFALAPNGKIYICPAFYFNNQEDYIGDLTDGINMKYDKLIKIENAPICQECDAYHCIRCMFLNKKLTGEYNIPSKRQCLVSIIERNISKEIQSELEKEGIVADSNYINEIDYLDPLEKIQK